jgi:hypothetical protein
MVKKCVGWKGSAESPAPSVLIRFAMVLGESMFNSSTQDSLISTGRRHILCFHTPPEITQPLVVAYGYEDVEANPMSKQKPIGLPILQYLSIKQNFLILHEAQRKSLAIMYFHDRFPKTLVSVLFFSLAPAIAQGNTAQTINSLDIFSSQKPCAQECFSANGYYCQVDVLASVLGCQNACNTNAPNYCYCRTDLQLVAESYLTSCVKSLCTVGDPSIDVSSAGSIYRYYCSSNGYPVNVPAATTQDSAKTTTHGGARPTTTHGGAQPTTTHDDAQPTITAYVTVYSSNGASSAGSAYFTVANICVLFSLISVGICDVSLIPFL